jgi:hypothetical protein
MIQRLQRSQSLVQAFFLAKEALFTFALLADI